LWEDLCLAQRRDARTSEDGSTPTAEGDKLKTMGEKIKTALPVLAVIGRIVRRLLKATLVVWLIVLLLLSYSFGIFVSLFLLVGFVCLLAWDYWREGSGRLWFWSLWLDTATVFVVGLASGGIIGLLRGFSNIDLPDYLTFFAVIA
jgi:hypothetical protein